MELASSDGSPTISLSQKSLGAYSGASLEATDENEATPPPPKKQRGHTNIMTSKVVAALDVCRVSDRQAVHLIAAIGEALQVDLHTITLNRTSIRLHREQVREAKALMIKIAFQNTELKAVILHWDGKLLFDLVKRELLDRLPIIVSSGDVEKLLGVPQLENGKGITQANSIYDVLEDWDLSPSIKALCCDTTASNLGNKNGAAILLERLLERDILFLPCRHHIFELILRAAFECQIPSTTGPNVPLFKKFRDDWKKIEQKNFQSGIDDERVKSILTSDHIERVASFVQQTLNTALPRDDYKELLNLTLIFLGCQPAQEVRFNTPGAFHHARWMSKANYSLKIYLFRNQFSLSSEEVEAFREICLFIVMLYTEAWFTAPKAAAAPNHDLQFLKKLHEYRGINEKISDVTVKKLSNHWWYLSPETVGLSFFDEQIPLTIKRRMVAELDPYNEMQDLYPNKFLLKSNNIDAFCNSDISKFVTPQTRNFFSRFEIDEDFLKLDPSFWTDNENFQKGLKTVRQMKIVNDVAERGVCLFTDYNQILSKSEDQKQFILQIVTAYRQRFPDATKETLLKSPSF